MSRNTDIELVGIKSGKEAALVEHVAIEVWTHRLQRRKYREVGGDRTPEDTFRALAVKWASDAHLILVGFWYLVLLWLCGFVGGLGGRGWEMGETAIYHLLCIRHSKFFFLMSVYLRERQRASGERGRQRITSRLPAARTEPNAGLELTTRS